jgi:alpha,alpha-trehalase
VLQIKTSSVIFDLDGVISDTASLHKKAWKIAFNKHIVIQKIKVKKFTYDDYYLHVDGKPRSNGIDDFFKSRSIIIKKKKNNQISDYKNEIFIKLIKTSNVSAFNDAVILIKKLKKKKIKIALASSSRNCRLIIKKLKLDKYFDYICDGSDLKKLNLPGKPSPHIFKKCFFALKTEPRFSTIIEDSISGVLAAKSSKVKNCIAIDRKKNFQHLKNAGADIIVKSLLQLCFNKQ